MSVGNGKAFIALLTDLSKAFDCLQHHLIIAKLNAYGFSLSSSRLIHSCLSDRKQRPKIISASSSCEEILFGVPQGSILGPCLFDIFICDLFSMLKHIDCANYGSDTAPYVIGDGAKEAIGSDTSHDLFCWFASYQMKANPDKCHLIASSDKEMNICVNNSNITKSKNY